MAPAAVPGRRKLNRMAAAALLRDLAGPLTAADMLAEFQPAPFGGPRRPSPLEQAVSEGSESGALDLILSPNERRERALLRPRVPRGAGGGGARDGGWGGIRRKGREALRRAPPELVADLEEMLLEAAASGAGGLLHVDCSYQRLLLHCLAEYHGLATSCPAARQGEGPAVAVEALADAARQSPLEPCARFLLNHPA